MATSRAGRGLPRPLQQQGEIGQRELGNIYQERDTPLLGFMDLASQLGFYILWPIQLGFYILVCYPMCAHMIACSETRHTTLEKYKLGIYGLVHIWRGEPT